MGSKITTSKEPTNNKEFERIHNRINKVEKKKPSVRRDDTATAKNMDDNILYLKKDKSTDKFSLRVKVDGREVTLFQEA